MFIFILIFCVERAMILLTVNFRDMWAGQFSVEANMYGGSEEVRKLSMVNIKIKWLIYTVLVGLIPILLRILIWSILQNKTIDFFNASDFVAFGLVLHISNINQIEHFNNLEKSWKTVQNGTSIFLITVYSVLFASHLFSQANPGTINVGAIRTISMILNGVSFYLSFSIYDNISKVESIP